MAMLSLVTKSKVLELKENFYPETKRIVLQKYLSIDELCIRSPFTRQLGFRTIVSDEP